MIYNANSKNIWDDEDGTTAVEFALVVTVFLAMMFGIFEAGRFFMSMNSLQYGVENATREALIDSTITDQQIIAIIASDMSLINGSTDDIQVNVVYTTLSDVDFIEVTGTYSYETIMPFLPDSWGSVPITANSRLAIP